MFWVYGTVFDTSLCRRVLWIFVMERGVRHAKPNFQRWMPDKYNC